DLKKGHMRLLQNWSDIKPRRLRLCVSEPGQGTARRWMCTHMPVATIVHAGSPRFYQISAASDRPDMQTTFWQIIARHRVNVPVQTVSGPSPAGYISQGCRTP